MLLTAADLPGLWALPSASRQPSAPITIPRPPAVDADASDDRLAVVTMPGDGHPTPDPEVAMGGVRHGSPPPGVSARALATVQWALVAWCVLFALLRG